MTPNAKLAEYNRNAVLSAPPAQLVVMLYDRLVLDMKRAEAAQLAENWSVASTNLTHAQAIVTELTSSLDLGMWDGAKDLHAIYNYLQNALIQANTNRDITITREAIALDRKAHV